MSNRIYQKKKYLVYNHSECICFFVVEKSDFGGYFGNAFGCFVKGLPISSDKEYPEYYKSHLRIGLSFFVDKEIAHRAFDLEYQEFDKEQRESIIRSLITSHALPFLKEISTKQGIKNASDKYPKLKYSMYTSLREAIGIPVDD